MTGERAPSHVLTLKRQPDAGTAQLVAALEHHRDVHDAAFAVEPRLWIGIAAPDELPKHWKADARTACSSALVRASAR